MKILRSLLFMAITIILFSGMLMTTLADNESAATEPVIVELSGFGVDVRRKLAGIEVSAVNVEEIGAFRFDINYDPAKIRFAEGRERNGRAVFDWDISITESIPGTLTISGTGPSPLTQNGSLIYIEFDYAVDFSHDLTYVSLSNLDVRDGGGQPIPANIDRDYWSFALPCELLYQQPTIRWHFMRIVPPYKTVYTEGEMLDLTGMRVYHVRGFSYGSGEDGKYFKTSSIRAYDFIVTFPVSILERPLTVNDWLIEIFDPQGSSLSFSEIFFITVNPAEIPTPQPVRRVCIRIK